MFLSISTTYNPATDLGFLLYKNPASLQTFELNFGKAHVFYPEASAQKATAVLMLDIDPIALSRDKRDSIEGTGLEHYVNDRSYVSSSFLSVAIAEVFGSALSGKSRERPALVAQPLPLQAVVAALPCRQGEEFLRQVFEPLGYTVDVVRHPLDEKFPAWGDSRYHTLTLRATTTVRELLTHLYVLIPVMDDFKHYAVGKDEVTKLLRHGEGWLNNHPHKHLIIRRYLRHNKPLTREALARLTEEDAADPDRADVAHGIEEEAVERKISLYEHRVAAVIATLKNVGAKRIVDLGCGDGRLLRSLFEVREFQELLGFDVSYRALEIAKRRLRYDDLPQRQKDRIKLIQGSLTYRDKRISGYDAAVCVEVIEHLDPPRLQALEQVIFQHAQPNTVIVTTPNVEYNRNFEGLPAGKLRHRDHRFEWTRQEFQSWGNRVAGAHGYEVSYLGIGPEDVDVGTPTQMGIFTKA